MRKNLKPWHLIAALIVICGGGLGSLYYFRTRAVSTPTAMVSCLPRSGAVLVYLDVKTLRDAGILDLLVGSKATEELEYRQFVENTGFDYRRDLSAIAGAFSQGSAHLVLRGNFDWKRMNAYAVAQGGTCNNSVCRVPGTNGRFTSFYPLRTNAMAIAFSQDEWAALDISPRRVPDEMAAPDQPIWILVTGPALRDVTALPAGARSFVSPLESARNITVAIGPTDNRLQVSLRVECPSDAAAADVVSQLQSATDLLRKMLARENMQPSPRDLSGVLVNGTFRREDRRVFGQWPMQRDFIEAIASGSVN